jgi:hypothetical protein
MATRSRPRFITPDSFSVAPHLLGLPLAEPRRRAAAMLVDLLAVALLANAGVVLLALAAAVALWRASASAKAGFIEQGVRTVLRVAAAILLFFGVYSAGQHILERATDESHDDTSADFTAALVPDSGTLADTLAAMRTDRERLLEINETLRADTASGGPGVLSFIKSIADDMGIGFGWGALYFTALLTLWKGQTLGKRLLGIRVIRLDGRSLSWWLSFERFGGYAASLSTGLLGFVQILWDRNRQGLHDKAVETVVIRVMPGAADAQPPVRH